MIKWYHPHLINESVNVWICLKDQPCFRHNQQPVSRAQPSTHNFKAHVNDKEILNSVSRVKDLRTQPFAMLSAVLQSINSKWFAMQLGIGYLAELDNKPRIEIRNEKGQLLGIAQAQAQKVPLIDIDTIVPFSHGYSIRLTSNDSSIHGFLLYRMETSQVLLTPRPLLPDSGKCIFIDTIVSGTPNAYAARCIDLFGDTSAFGMVYSVSANQHSNCMPSFTNVSRVQQGTRLEWITPCTNNASYKLHRVVGEKAVMLYQGNSNAFIDTSSLPGAYKYQLSVFANGEKTGTANADYFVEDARGPGAPKDLLASSRTGEIELDWTAPMDTDVVGYHIYRSLDSSYSHLIGVNQLSVTGTHFSQHFKKENSSTFYYTIQAEDRSGNRGAHSALVKVTLPDIIPPLRPVLKPLRTQSHRTVINWHPNPEPDLAGYLISLLGDSTQPIQTLSPDNNSYEVHDSLGGVRSFSIRAFDKHGNTSNATVLRDVLIGNVPLTGSFAYVKCRARKKRRSIELEWQFDASKVSGYAILGTLSTLPHHMISNNQWVIEGLRPGQFEFRIKAILKDGNTAISEPCKCAIKD